MRRIAIGCLALFASTVGAALTGEAVAQSAPAAEAAAPADAAPAAAAKPKAKAPKKGGAMVVVVVTNGRSIPLSELDVAPTGTPQAKQIIANLAPGKKAKVKIAHGKSCVFDLHGAYEDGSSTELSSVDLCKDGNVNLVE